MNKDKQRLLRYSSYLGKVAILFVAYFVTARFGLSISPVSGFATLVWPPTGISLAALLLFGPRLWPGIFFAAFLVNFSVGAGLGIALGMAIGNTLGPLLATYLFNKLSSFNNLERLRCALALIAVAFISTLVSATIGTSSLLLGESILLAEYSDTWWAWWIGDSLGILLVGSLLLINWKNILNSKLSYRTLLHFFAIESFLILASTIAFWGVLDSPSIFVFYLIFTPLIWAALRFGQSGGVVAVFSMTSIAIWGVIGGYGSFAEGSLSQNLSVVQIFMGSIAVNILILGAVVSERKSNQKELEEKVQEIERARYLTEQEQAKYEALLSSIGDGIIAIDKAGVVIFMNEAAGKALGFIPAEAMGQFLTDIVRAEDEKGNLVPKDKRPISLALSSGQLISSQHLEAKYFYVGKGKNKFPVSMTISPVRIGQEVVGAVEVFRDVTKELMLDKAKSEFISVASHQLRTPVTAAKWLTELFRESIDKLSPRERQYLEDLSTSVDRLSKLVEDLLNVSRIELGSLKMEKINIDIVKFTEDFMKDLKPYAELKKHILVLDKPKENLVNVEIDSKILYNVLQNLVSNAIDYSAGGTTVTVKIEKEDGVVRTSILNDGPVIPEEEQEKLFQKFYRGESTKKMKTEGTGLGLYIVKSNIESSGGSIGFSSKKGERTVFWFTLPLKK